MIWDWGWGWWMGIGMVAFWALVAVVIWAIVRAPQPHAPYGTAPTAKDILAERFARGEISAEEYEERQKVLTGR